MKLFSLKKSSVFAFSSTQNTYLALGSTGDTIGEDFQSTSTFEVYNLRGKCLSSVQADSGFNSIAWSMPQHFSASNTGLIAAAQLNGAVSVYSGDKLFDIFLFLSIAELFFLEYLVRSIHA